MDVALQEDLLDINGSPVHLDKLLLNLVTNAVEANLVPGTVTISDAQLLRGPAD